MTRGAWKQDWLVPALLLLSYAALCTAVEPGEEQPGEEQPGEPDGDQLHPSNARIYVVDLPPKYNIYTLVHEDCEEGQFLKDLLGSPLGPTLEDSSEMAMYRESPYYGMEVHMHLQMLYSPLRVFTVDEADLVYVPFYATQLQYSMLDEGACKPNWTAGAAAALVAEFWADAPALMPALGAKPHWMQLSEIEETFHGGCGEEWGIPLMCHPLTEHVIFATPEPLSELHPDYWRMRFYGPRRPHANNSLAVPYLGHIHRLSMDSRARLAVGGAAGGGKDLLAAMSYAQMRHASLRLKLTEDCNRDPRECWYLRFRFESLAQSVLEVIDSYQRAWFCLQPYGDTPTRSALSDCIASGLAIPVVFDDYMFDMLPFADVIDFRSMMVYVDPDEVQKPEVSVLDFLHAYSVDARNDLLESVRRVAHAFQYAVQPNHLLVRFDSLSLVHPLDDAFTMSLKAVLRLACRHSERHCQERAGEPQHGSLSDASEDAASAQSRR